MTPLTEEDIEEIRELRFSRRWAIEEICDMFNITKQQLKEIMYAGSDTKAQPSHND